jgi:hypothetical protein
VAVERGEREECECVPRSCRLPEIVQPLGRSFDELVNLLEAALQRIYSLLLRDTPLPLEAHPQPPPPKHAVNVRAEGEEGDRDDKVDDRKAIVK